MNDLQARFGGPVRFLLLPSDSSGVSLM